MKLEVKKIVQGPVLAAKGDTSIGSAAGTTGVCHETDKNSTVCVGKNEQNQPSVGYKCLF